MAYFNRFRLFPLFLIALSVSVLCSGQAGPREDSIRIPPRLKEYLRLSNEQTATLERTLTSFHHIMAIKSQEIKAARNRAAQDQSTTVTRAIESSQIQIDRERSTARDQIASTLTHEQACRLELLRTYSSRNESLAQLATDAAAVNLIDIDRSQANPAVGGTTSIFSPDSPVVGTADKRQKGNPQSKRSPPSSPPQ